MVRQKAIAICRGVSHPTSRKVGMGSSGLKAEKALFGLISEANTRPVTTRYRQVGRKSRYSKLKTI